MKITRQKVKGALSVTMLSLALLLTPRAAVAHCDTLDGPVVADARSALTQGEVYPVLKWVKAEDEEAIRSAFLKTLKVRAINSAAQELADMYFFETLVRIHRAGEGAPYTGLKPAGAVEPVVAKADKALEQGSVDPLANAIAAHTREGVHARFNHAFETRKHAHDSVQAGRNFVEAYVSYVHYVEAIAKAVHQTATHSETMSSGTHPH